jgi:hypothetical protein
MAFQLSLREKAMAAKVVDLLTVKTRFKQKRIHFWIQKRVIIP